MYCTPGKVREANELLNNEEAFPDKMVTPWITKAQARIDAVLKSRYVVPLLDPVPTIVESIAQDMATGFLIAHSFGNQLGQEQINLSNQLLKRADNDLAELVDKEQLDGLPGIKLASIPGGGSAPVIGSTTNHPSPIEGILNKW